jgi:hypothetical protein
MDGQHTGAIAIADADRTPWQIRCGRPETESPAVDELSIGELALQRVPVWGVLKARGPLASVGVGVGKGQPARRLGGSMSSSSPVWTECASLLGIRAVVFALNTRA